MPRPEPGDPPATPQPGAPGLDAPELGSDDPRGFGWRVLHERTPALIRQVRDAHPYGPRERRALDSLLAEIPAGPVRPLGPGAADRDRWDAWGAAYFGRPWAKVPFLWWESYFYRRLLEAVGFFAPGPWRGVDPFERWKTDELRGPGLAADLARAGRPATREALLLASLWGNQADLGFLFDAAGRPDARGRADLLVADDGAALWDVLESGGPGDVGLVADNAGRELLADLLLVDHLLTAGLAATVTVYLKPWPYYVSDATTADLVAVLRRLAEADEPAREVARRLSRAAGDGRLRLRVHDFLCAPWSFHRMPADLAADLGAHTVTVLKGDLNYRRLVGDRAWPPDTPFDQVTAYFPGPVAALRTLKSDVLTGVGSALPATPDDDWRTDGTHGLVQVRR